MFNRFGLVIELLRSQTALLFRTNFPGRVFYFIVATNQHHPCQIGPITFPLRTGCPTANEYGGGVFDQIEYHLSMFAMYFNGCILNSNRNVGCHTRTDVNTFGPVGNRHLADSVKLGPDESMVSTFFPLSRAE